MTFTLGDASTLDTVLACQGCGQERRYNFSAFDGHSGGIRDEYDEFLEWAVEDANRGHSCSYDDSEGLMRDITPELAEGDGE